MRTWSGRAVAAIAISGLALAACSSGTKHPAAPTSSSAAPTTSTTTSVTTPASTRPRARLEFREVTDQVPIATPACHHKNPAIAPARDGKSCFVVGPVLLTGAGVVSATVEYDSNSTQWAVNIHFANNDFVTKVAVPYLNKTIAIVLNGVVQAAPIINPGITGSDVEISSNFTRAAATNVAASILGVAPSQVHS
jgi:preprotein translocase subunit SecD